MCVYKYTYTYIYIYIYIYIYTHTHIYIYVGLSGASVIKNLLAILERQEVQVPNLGQEDPLEEEMAIYSRILARRIPWTKEPGRLQFLGPQRV